MTSVVAGSCVVSVAGSTGASLETVVSGTDSVVCAASVVVVVVAASVGAGADSVVVVVGL